MMRLGWRVLLGGALLWGAALGCNAIPITVPYEDSGTCDMRGGDGNPLNFHDGGWIADAPISTPGDAGTDAHPYGGDALVDGVGSDGATDALTDTVFSDMIPDTVFSDMIPDTIFSDSGPTSDATGDL